MTRSWRHQVCRDYNFVSENSLFPSLIPSYIRRSFVLGSNNLTCFLFSSCLCSIPKAISITINLQNSVKYYNESWFPIWSWNCTDYIYKTISNPTNPNFSGQLRNYATVWACFCTLDAYHAERESCEKGHEKIGVEQGIKLVLNWRKLYSRQFKIQRRIR